MKEHLDKAFNLIAAIRVSGDDQERVVAAKNELRAAFRELEQQEKEAAESGRQSNQ